jgi:hypothetical protein
MQGSVSEGGGFAITGQSEVLLEKTKDPHPDPLPAYQEKGKKEERADCPVCN